MGFDDDLLAEFISESREHLLTLVPDLVALEKQKEGADPELVNRIFRALHSIKGSSSFFEFSNVKRLSHVLEDLLGRVREKTLPITSELIDLLLAGADRLSTLIEDLANSDSIDVEADIQRATALAEGATADGGKPRPAVAASPDGSESVAVSGPIGSDRIGSETATDPSRFGSPQRPAPVLPSPALPFGAPLPPDLVKRAKAHGLRLYAVSLTRDDLSTRSADEFAATIGRIGELLSRRDEPGGTQLTCLTVLETDLLGDALALPPARIKAQSLTPGAAPAPAQSPLPAAEARSKGPVEFVRIGTGPLGRLLELAGELVLSRNQALTLLGGRGGVPGLQGVLQKLDLVTTEMQDRITRLRIQSMEQLFAKLPRLVRDVSRQLGKEIELEIAGNEVELDRSILEQLSDPITHLLRNSADHGIETPDVRRAAGKPERGRISVRAFHEGGQVHVEVSDDGRGIDPEKVRKKAIERGLLTAADAAKLDETDTLRLIFTPGFSTAEKVSQISGRGVGMDVVATNVERLGGTVTLRSELGKGMAVRLRLPLTLAIIPALVVGVRDAFVGKDGKLGSREQRFAVPQICLREIIRVRATEVIHKFEKIQGAPVLRLRDHLLPLTRLADVLSLARPYVDPATGEVRVDRRKNIADRRIEPERVKNDRRRNVRAQNVLTLQAGDDRFGLIVDELYDHQEIVVKPLSGYAKEARCYAGATILGDGAVAMILDAPGVAVLAGLRSSTVRGEEQRRRQARAEALAAIKPRETVLLFAHTAEEQLAFPLASLARIQKIDLAKIEVVGGEPFVQWSGGTVRVARLSDHLPLTPIDARSGPAVLLLPKGQPEGRPPTGFLASRVLDTDDFSGDLAPASVQQPGVRGSAPMRGRLTLFVDPERLLEHGAIRDLPHPRPA